MKCSFQPINLFESRTGLPLPLFLQTFFLSIVVVAIALAEQWNHFRGQIARYRLTRSRNRTANRIKCRHRDHLNGQKLSRSRFFLRDGPRFSCLPCYIEPRMTLAKRIPRKICWRLDEVWGERTRRLLGESNFPLSLIIRRLWRDLWVTFIR